MYYPPPSRMRAPARYRSKFTGAVERQLMARLEKITHICGDDFSAADCIIGHNVTWARAYGRRQNAIFSAYLSRLSKRPAFISAFADVDQFQLAVLQGKSGGKFTG